MKTFKSIMLALVLLVGTSVFANTETTPKDRTLISQEIGNLLKDPGFSVEKEVLAEVKFILNSDRELVVLSVGSASMTVENYVKKRLNYQKLNSDLEVGKEYTIGVKILS